VFSFAVLLTELVGNCLPWPDVTNTVAAVAVHRGERTPVPERMTPLLRAVVDKCWAQAADARPSMADVVAMLNTDDGQDLLASPRLDESLVAAAAAAIGGT
jgi:hypothetical protein